MPAARRVQPGRRVPARRAGRGRRLVAGLAVLAVAFGAGACGGGGASHATTTARSTVPVATTSAAPEPSATAETPSGATLSLPALKADQTPLIRTDFSDDDAWDRVVAAVRAPAAFDGETYTPPIVPVSDRTFDGLTAPALTAGRPRDRCGHAILADAASMRAA